MSELEPLIADLALILICAGVMTLLFKRLKQPVVLGRTLPSIGGSGRGGSMVGIFIVLAIVFSIVFSPRLRKHSEQMTKTFNDNLSEREQMEQRE